jgi:hypothetical protein
MEKECGNIKITETEDGYNIEIKGKSLKASLSGCCGPMVMACCHPADKECKGEEKNDK